MKVKIDYLHEKKFDSRTTSGYFICYPKKFKRYIFYYSNYNMRIVESRNARFNKMAKLKGVQNPKK